MPRISVLDNRTRGAMSVGAFAIAGILLTGCGGDAEPTEVTVTETATTTETTTTSTAPSPTTADRTTTQTQITTQAPPQTQMPGPPNEAGAGMEWAVQGPFGGWMGCDQNAANWPSNTSECFEHDGAYYYWALRQAAR